MFSWAWRNDEIEMKWPRGLSSRSWISVHSRGVPARCRLGQLTLAKVAENVKELQEIDLYERVLLDTYVRTKHAGFSLAELCRLFAQADRVHLRAAGDPLPGPGPFRLYRGIAGPEPTRRVYGLSWTQSIRRAREFAQEHACRFSRNRADPGVYCVTVEEGGVLAYIRRRGEREFIVNLPTLATPERLEWVTAPSGRRENCLRLRQFDASQRSGSRVITSP